MSALTWDQVRARSERNGCYCYDCWVVYHLCGHQLPCNRHATPEEHEENRRLFSEAINNASWSEHPLFARIERDIDENEPPLIPQRKREP